MFQWAIRPATKPDLRKIATWLHREMSKGIDGNFHCNLPEIEQGFKEGRLLAMVDQPSKMPVAFCLGYLAILAVKADYRRKGLGRILALHVLELARQAGEFGVVGECVSRDSLEFCLRIGFATVSENANSSGNYLVAYPFGGSSQLPPGAGESMLKIHLFRYCDSERPDFEFETPAAIEEDVIILKRHLVHYGSWYDHQIRIELDGKQIWLKKVKYSSEIGVERDCQWIRARSLRIPADSGK